MKLRVLQVLFVAASLLCAAMVVRQGQPHLIPATQAQGDHDGPFHGDGPANFREARPADRTAAIASIQAQLDAFRRDDFKTAIRYQSHALRSQFPSPAAFQQMMQVSYPAFLHFHSVAFHGAGTPDQGGHVYVFVTLHQADGSLTRAIYIMVREGDTYKVDGVTGGPDGGPGPAPQARDGQLT